MIPSQPVQHPEKAREWIPDTGTSHEHRRTMVGNSDLFRTVVSGLLDGTGESAPTNQYFVEFLGAVMLHSGNGEHHAD